MSTFQVGRCSEEVRVLGLRGKSIPCALDRLGQPRPQHPSGDCAFGSSTGSSAFQRGESVASVPFEILSLAPRKDL